MMKLSNCCKIFKAFSNPQRLKIFMSIYGQCCGPKSSSASPKAGAKDKFCCSQGQSIEKAFTKMCDCMDLSRSTISHHFKELRDAGLITCERQGRIFRCRVNKEALDCFKEFMK